MSVIHTLRGAQAPSRSDGAVWTRVKVDRSATGTDPWTLAVDDQLLSPVETDGNNPLVRNITFDDTEAAAYYRLRFIDAAGNESPPTDEVYDDGSAAPDWKPSIAAVGALLRARTVTEGGQELGTFNGSTRPTGEQANELIDQAVSDVVDVTGLDIPDTTWSAARTVATYRAAMLIELSYFPEQVNTNRSPYAQLERLYDKRLVQLTKSVREAGGGDLPGAVDDAKLPSGGGFPTTAIGMENPW